MGAPAVSAPDTGRRTLPAPLGWALCLALGLGLGGLCCFPLTDSYLTFAALDLPDLPT
ncbi:hypothetical protein [Blastococcus sp. CT_GayMR16]|uniref:hypothetical protein n=1 Tax=Blastococcus sp. CT_GayMR16 TaxID=2559607 RepID=UPI0014305CE4|nr:hypothetical protein [Blastococcus sp. CT_GayMR16]